MTSSIWRFGLLFFAVLCHVPSALAQIDRASLKGTVTDASGALLPHTQVTVEFPQTGFSRAVTTSDAGDYVLPGLPLGECTISATAAGFESKRISGVILAVGDFKTVDIALGVGGVDQNVSISAATVTLDHDSASTGGLVSREQVLDLPINGRNWAGLMILVPGAVNTGNGNQTSIRFAGHALDDNKILFDGVDATGILRQSEKTDLRIQLSSESIAEFRVETALYSAQFGGTPGGQGDVVSRTGTRTFHGSVYEFLRNDVLNARALFSTSQLPLRLNQYGASLGGPLRTNKAFFFLNYEALRQTLTQPLVGFVPSAAFLQQTGISTPGLLPLLKAYPAGQTATANPNISQVNGSGKNLQNEDFGLARLDYRLSDKTSAFVRVNFDQGRLQSPLGDSSGFLKDALSTQNNPKNGVISVQHIFLPTLLNDFKFGANRTPFTTQNVSPLTLQLQVPGLSTLHDNLLQVQNATAYSIVDTLDISFGKHSIATGGGLRRVEINLGNSAETQLTYTSLAKFAANALDTAAVLAAVPTEGVRKTEYDFFIQDQYKFHSNLTLSLGLRYDSYGVFSEVNGRAKPFDPVACGGFCPAGTPFYRPDHTDIGPRLAVTWAPAYLHDRTVLRAGYGLYFGEGQLGDLTGPLNNLTTRLGLTSTQFPTLSYPIDPYVALGANTANAPRGLAQFRVNEQISQWGASIQQSMPHGILAEIGYIGSHGAHIPSRTYLNVLDPITKTRPLPTFGQVDYKKMGNNAHFHGLSATLSRQFFNGLQFGANYLWSHSINDDSTGGGEQDYPQNVACRVCERASSDQDIRSSFTASTVYTLPFGHGRRYLQKGVASYIAGGWQISGIAVARTGLPLNITNARSAASVPDGNSTSPQRPDLVQGASFIPSSGRTPLHWINPAAFATPAAGTFGNAPRNLLRGPGTWQIDSSIDKTIFALDRLAFSFRGEGFNLFNRAQYGLPTSNFSAGNFGVITTQLTPGATGTGTQRVFQVSLRAAF